MTDAPPRETVKQVAEFRYKAFISYSHRDERWAVWLHRALERYRVPRRLVGRDTQNGKVSARLSPVFRDRDELSTASNLGRVVTAALEQAATLIVVCSPAAAKSRWVNEEIRTFIGLGRAERILCLIVDGDPSGPADLQCFPGALLEARDGSTGAAEPVAADVRPGKDGRRGALLKIIAGLLGVQFDELVRREQHRRQQRLAVITTAAVAGMALTSVLAVLAIVARNEAVEQRSRAEVAAATSDQTTRFLVQLFAVADPSESRGSSVTAREILDRGALRIDRDLAAQPQVRAALLSTMGRAYTGLGLYEPATELLSRARDARGAIAPGPNADAVTTSNLLGDALYEKGDYSAAEKAYGEALAAARVLHPDGDAGVTAAMTGLAAVQVKNGDYAGAQMQYEAALALDRSLQADVDVARDLSGLATAVLFQQEYSKSEAAFRESLAIRRRVLGEDHPLVPQTLNDLAVLLYFSGQAAAAEPFFHEAATLYERILGHEHPFVSSIENNLGRIALEKGDVAAAQALLSDALAIDRKLKDPGHDDFVYSLNNLGVARLGLDQPDSALPLFEEARGIAEPLGHRMLGQIWANLADTYWRIGRLADAHRALELARPLLAAAQPDEPWQLANLASIEGAVRVKERDLAGAEPLLVDGYKIVAERWGAQGLFAQLAARRLALLDEPRRKAGLPPTAPPASRN